MTPKPPARWRWGLCWLMFASTVLSYMDRQAMSLVGPSIKAEFQSDNQGFGWVMAAFFLSYALFQVPAGYIADRRDVRLVYAWAVTWWSIAAAAMAFSPTLGVLMVVPGVTRRRRIVQLAVCTCGRLLRSCLRPIGVWGTGSSIRGGGWRGLDPADRPEAVALVRLASHVRHRRLARFGLGRRLAVHGSWSESRPARRSRPSGTSPTDEFGGQAPGLSPVVQATFGSVLVLAILIGLSSYRFGYQAIWWAIAVFDVRAADRSPRLAFPVTQGDGLGRSAGRGRPTAAILGSRGRLDFDQRLLAFPDQLAADLFEGRSGDDLPGERDVERLAVPGGRRRQPGRWCLVAIPGGSGIEPSRRGSGSWRVVRS